MSLRVFSIIIVLHGLDIVETRMAGGAKAGTGGGVKKSRFSLG